jgi:hypothetical protein
LLLGLLLLLSWVTAAVPVEAMFDWFQQLMLLLLLLLVVVLEVQLLALQLALRLLCWVTAAPQHGQGQQQLQRPQVPRMVWVMRALLLLPLLHCCHWLLRHSGGPWQVMHAPWQEETGLSCAFCQESPVSSCQERLC